MHSGIVVFDGEFGSDALKCCQHEQLIRFWNGAVDCKSDRDKQKSRRQVRCVA